MLESNLLFVYNTLTLSISILLTGLVMLKGPFGKSTVYLGAATGLAGIVAVVGPAFASFLKDTILLASTLTTLWIFFVGYGLYRLGQPGKRGLAGVAEAELSGSGS